MIIQSQLSLVNRWRDRHEVRQSMRRMIEQPDMVSRLSEGATEFIASFDWQDVAREYCNLYEKVILRNNYR